MKKDIFKTIKHGLIQGGIIGSVALIIVCAGFYIFIKAWQSNSTGLPMDSSSPSALYVDEGETLTAAKRNKLIQNTLREEVDLGNTDSFDTKCERKRANENGTIFIAGMISINKIYREFSKSTDRLIISKDNKNKITRYDGTQVYTTTHLRRKCQ